MGDYEVYYITKGPIRGPCEHKHRTIDYAYHCLRHDYQAAEKDGRESLIGLNSVILERQ